MDSVDTSGGPSSSTTDDSMTGAESTDSSTSGSGSSEDTMDPTTGGVVGCDEGAGMSFTMLTSADNDMVTNLDVAGLVACNQDITITATGGTVCAIDNGDGDFFYTVETIALADVPPLTCGLAQVGLTNMSISNIGDGTEVVVPMGGGAMTGNQSIEVLGDVEGTALGMPIGPVPLTMFEGVLPEGDASFGASDTTMTYADDATVIATAMPEVVPGTMVTITLTGLNGSLTFAM